LFNFVEEEMGKILFVGRRGRKVFIEFEKKS